jgi:hypothetical protein
MKLNLFLVAVIFSGLFWNACSSKLGTQYLSGLSQAESDSAIVTPQGAVFLFKMNTGGSWHWYRDKTSTGKLEYGWQAKFNFNEEHYSCGVSVFKHPFAEPTSGTFKELVEDAQVDLSVRTSTSGTQMDDNQYAIGFASKRINNVRVEAVVDPEALMIILREPIIIEKFTTSRPDSVTFLTFTPNKTPETKRVVVSYFAED